MLEAYYIERIIETLIKKHLKCLQKELNVNQVDIKKCYKRKIIKFELSVG